jgi:hypothetical protein
VLVQDGVDVKAIAVMFTWLFEPEAGRASVLKVPDPAEKLIAAVVEVTVFVPLTLYVTV